MTSYTGSVFKHSNTNDVVLNIHKLSKMLPQDLSRKFIIYAESMQQEIRSSFEYQKHGEVCKHGRTYLSKGKVHIASAPGEEPAYLSGTLSNSVAYMVTGTKDSREAVYWCIEIGCTISAPYAKYLEYGTSRMKPRPFLRPVILEYAYDMLDSFSMLGDNARPKTHIRKDKLYVDKGAFWKDTVTRLRGHSWNQNRHWRDPDYI